MAPSRYRGSRCRDFGVDVLRSNDYYPEHHDWQRIQGWDLQNDIRQRNGKEGDDGHEQYPYFLGTCNPNASSRQMQKLGWCSRTLMDREPGELSGGSRSGIEDEVKKSEGEDDASSRKKRKFSPISRDLDDKKKNSVLHSKIINAEWERSALPSPPALLRVSHDPTLVKRIKISEDLSASLDQKASVSSVQYWQLKNDDEPEKMEEADCGPVRTISFSRWADANYAIEHDEGASSDVEILTNSRENSPLASAQDQRTVSGEVIVGEGSEESASYASVSCGLYREVHIELVEDMIDDLYVQGGKGNVKENDGSIGTYTLVEGLRVETLETVKPPCRRISMLQGCRSVDEFEKLNKINEGTYGIVYRARDTKTGEIVALKKVKMEKEREGFPLTSLREINILLSVHHPSIVEVKEVVVGGNLDGIFTVMEYMDHDLKGLMKTMKKPFHLSEVKCLMLQLLSGVKHLHDNWILHRDLKASNLLFNNCGELKICDFGLSRQYGSPLKPYTQLVVTLWYRAPELLLGAEKYSTAIDMWSLGCIMAELLAKEPLFPGKSELDQLDKIFRVLGTPDEKIWPGFTRLPGAKANFTMKSSKLHEKFPRMSPASFLGRTFLSNAGFDLLNKLLTYDPEKRLTAVEALNHPWFLESPLPTSKDFMPTFPAQHAQNRHQKRIMKGPDPQDLLRQGIDNS